MANTARRIHAFHLYVFSRTYHASDGDWLERWRPRQAE
jgi:hypothetical protein